MRGECIILHGGVAFAPPLRADDCSWPGSCGRTYMRRCRWPRRRRRSRLARPGTLWGRWLSSSLVDLACVNDVNATRPHTQPHYLGTRQTRSDIAQPLTQPFGFWSYGGRWFAPPMATAQLRISCCWPWMAAWCTHRDAAFIALPATPAPARADAGATTSRCIDC